MLRGGQQGGRPVGADAGARAAGKNKGAQAATRAAGAPLSVCSFAHPQAACAQHVLCCTMPLCCTALQHVLCYTTLLDADLKNTTDTTFTVLLEKVSAAPPPPLSPSLSSVHARTQQACQPW